MSRGDSRWLGALRYGVAAGVEHVRALKSLGEMGTVVDIGANRGQFALAARHCFPGARIVSFEPLPGPAEKFRRVLAGDSRLVLHQVAIGPARGEETIHISAADDSSSLLPITGMQRSLFPGTGEVGTAVVQVAPLSEFLPAEEIEPPALLKLDVQGYELEALKGCEALLSRFSTVYAECSFAELYEGQALTDEVIAWLRDRGFRLSGVYHMSYDGKGRAIQADFLFTRTAVYGVSLD
ncbi:Methyltransferase FkbM [Nitrosococcus oceani ATCC 19707]|uniref:Methyltransferase FkbM n=3 Tax=Nitrosococcus oceani TaxID=1229 RepID=Q3JAZ3_NITOC|nr:Methyltransferase FkbM [Nitrosococcus oceani ATCC 19707]EDZ67699.1 methyltransferase, FkbM family protein [Nitrosococcus oceani AFC27]KFI19570.1 methyltransferase FkbM [Nitrosococcus oceani C-27]